MNHKRVRVMGMPYSKEKLICLLLKGLGCCFLLEALSLTLALGFTIKASSLVGFAQLLETPEPTLLGSMGMLLDLIIISTALIGYYLLAYAFLRLRNWAIPLAVFLNALLLVQELWRFLFPWEIDEQQIRKLTQEIATRGGYIFNEQLFADVWSTVNQPFTVSELAGRGSLVILLFILYSNRAYLATVLK